MLALLHQLAGHALVGHGVEVVARAGHLAHADDLHGHGGARLGELLALGAGHGADAAHGGAGDDHVALLQGAVLHQQGGHGAAAHLQQIVDALAGLGGDGADDGLAAPLLGHQLILGELLLDALGVGLRLIHLVNGHDDGDVGRLGVVDGLNRLGHDAVVGGHHQDGHIGDHGAAGAHGGEGLVAGGVQEGDGLALHVHLIGADVLGDAAGLARRHVGVADIVQQGGLAVVDVAHDHHHGGAGLQILLLVLGGVDEPLLDGDNDLLFHLAAQLLGNDGGGVEVDDVAEGGHDAVLHQGLDHLGAGLLHTGGQLAHADGVWDLDSQRSLFGDLQLEPAHLLLLLLAALAALEAALALVAALELLLAGLHLLGLARSQVLQPLVVLLQVHLAALAGVHYLLLGDAGSGPVCRLLGRLRLALGLLGRGPARRRGGLLRLGRGLGGLPLGGRGSLGLPVDLGVDALDVVHLVVLGQVLEDQGELPVLQHLHMVLGSRRIFRQNVGDLLGVLLEILGHLVHAILVVQQISHLHRRAHGVFFLTVSLPRGSVRFPAGSGGDSFRAGGAAHGFLPPFCSFFSWRRCSFWRWRALSAFSLSSADAAP